ncbi:MAG: SDR family oxidoreductase [Deltaproteobacteria bacterium]|nr:MAG: SDR family oxidoreductase [Deltaproteobacteria bacterium]
MKDALSLQGKHALVCGASAGIGRATALALASLGAEVTALARREDRLSTLVPELEAAGASAARYVVADLDQRDALEETIKDLLQQHGPVHVWINNTGGPPPGSLLTTNEEQLVTALGRHLLAAQRIMKLVVPGMEEAGYGRIISVLSTSVRAPIPNLGVSNLTRAAMASWSKTLSNELPPNITINCILPGFTATERLSSLAESRANNAGKTVEEVETAWKATIPEGRLGRPEELAATIAFLASPAASYVRGVCIPIDGGRLPVI